MNIDRHKRISVCGEVRVLGSLLHHVVERRTLVLRQIGAADELNAVGLSERLSPRAALESGVIGHVSHLRAASDRSGSETDRIHDVSGAGSDSGSRCGDTSGARISARLDLGADALDLGGKLVHALCILFRRFGILGGILFDQSLQLLDEIFEVH